MVTTRIICRSLTRILTILSVLLLTACAAFSDSPPAGSDQDAVSLLRLMVQAERNLRLTGTQVTEAERNGRLVRSVQTVTRDGVHGLRYDYLQPPNRVGETVVDNGQFRWHYIPNRNVIQVGPSTISQLAQRIRQLLNRLSRLALNVRLVGPATIAGRNCEELEIDSQSNPPVVMRRFWVDVANGAQLRIEQYDNQGIEKTTSYFTDISYNPQITRATFSAPPVPANVVTEAPPVYSAIMTVDQASQMAGFQALQPQYMPDGFRFQSAAITQFGNSKVIGLRYANGVAVLSLFETPERGRVLPQIVHRGAGVAMATVSGLHIILVGSIDDSDLNAIISSLR